MDIKKEAKLIGVPAKVLWYLPPIPIFKKLFRNASHAKNLTGHQDGRKDNFLLQHPANALQWMPFYLKYDDFSSEPINLRLDLLTDWFEFSQCTNIIS